jgi:hypothetical protein
MALESFDELVTAIGEQLDRDDLEDQVPDFIRLNEDRLFAEIRIRDMLKRSQATLTASAAGRYLALPQRFAQMKTFRLLTTPKVTTLEPVNLDAMNRRRRECPSRPGVYTVHEEIEFDVEPDQAYTAEMIFYENPLPLSADNQTNALLAAAPSLYLYGSLIHTAPFLLHDERIPVWNGLYTASRDAINLAARKAEHSGPLISRVSGPTP